MFFLLFQLFFLFLRNGFYYFVFNRFASQIIRKMIPIMSKIQSIGPAKKWRTNPNSHRIKMIMAISTSKLTMLPPFLFRYYLFF